MVTTGGRLRASADQIECVAFAGDICGEGAVWHPEQRALYWTDINRFLVHRFTRESGATHTWQFWEPVTAVNLTTDPDRFLLVFGSSVGLWSPCTHPHVETIFRLACAPEMRFNDAGVDARGSLWVGTMRNNVSADGEDLDVPFEGGVLYRIEPNGSATEWKHGVGISNTVAWSPDSATFYFGDTTANAIYQFDYDARTGDICNERPFLVAYPHGLPDGSATDSEGCLWNTRPGPGCLIRITPNGDVDRIVDLPVSRPTTCAFGGDDLKTLYITSARSPDRLSGSVFALHTGVGGIPENRFRLR
jgi:sugar lactone lactonase YvrE